MRRPFVLGFLLALTACSSSSGGTTPAGVLELSISSELQIPGDVDIVTVQVSNGGAMAFEQTYNLPSDASLPGTLVLETDGDASAAPKGTINPQIVPVGAPGTLTITVQGSHATTQVASRSAKLTLSSGMSKKLEIPLQKSCFEIACSADQTCVDGTCKTSQIDAASLPSL